MKTIQTTWLRLVSIILLAVSVCSCRCESLCVAGSLLEDYATVPALAAVAGVRIRVL